MKIPNNDAHWSDTQRAMAQRIIDEPDPQNKARGLLKWALARVVFYGPQNEPIAQMIDQYLTENGGCES